MSLLHIEKKLKVILIRIVLPCPFLLSFLLTSWRAVRSYRPHLEERDLIWGDDWSHNSFFRRSPNWDFLRVSSAVRQMPGDLCAAPRIISLSHLSLATDVTDVTDVIFGTSGLWPRTRTEAGGTATLTKSFFWPQPMAPWATRQLKEESKKRLVKFRKVIYKRM